MSEGTITGVRLNDNTVSNLVTEIQMLRNRLDLLESKSNSLIIQDSLKAIWDNQKDDIWSSI